MRMVREFPTMAVSIMRELAHRLELTNNQLRNALSEVRRLREAPPRRRCSRKPGPRRRNEPPRQLYPPPRSPARLPQPRRRTDPRNRRGRARTGARQRPHLRPPARTVPRPRDLCVRAPGRGPPGLRAAAGAADPRRYARDPAGAAGSASAGGWRWPISMSAPATRRPIWHCGRADAAYRAAAGAGGVLVSDPSIDAPELAPLPLPDGIAAERYHLYPTRNDCRPPAGVPAGSRRSQGGPKIGPPASCRHAGSPKQYQPMSIMTGTWSEAFSQLRLSRWTWAALRAPTKGGVTQMWSRRRPRSLAAQSRLR